MPPFFPRPGPRTFDDLRPFPKSMLVRRIGAVGEPRRHELCAVAAATLDR